jgi:hypothetical protein
MAVFGFLVFHVFWFLQYAISFCTCFRQLEVGWWEFEFDGKSTVESSTC